MARQRRIEFPGAVYHVISRGIERRDLFRDDADRRRYRSLLEKAVGRFHFRLYAYCLMNNHVHLALETGKIPLSRIMRSINTSYAGYFNLRHKRSGYLFQGRYRALLVDRDAYLLSLVRYIHENPVKAGITANPEAYPWSSHQSYLQRAPAWIAADEVLERFGSRRSAAIRAFKAFFEKEEEEPYANCRVHSQLAVGDASFAAKTLERLPSESIPVRRLTASQLVDWVAKHHGLASTALRGVSRRRDLARVRTIAALLGPSVGVSIAAIARELNRSQPSLWQSVEALIRSADEDKPLRRLLKMQADHVVRHANNL